MGVSGFFFGNTEDCLDDEGDSEVNLRMMMMMMANWQNLTMMMMMMSFRTTSLDKKVNFIKFHLNLFLFLPLKNIHMYCT